MQGSRNREAKTTRAEAHEYERKMQDLLEKLEIVESKLKTTNDQKFKILQKLKETEEENETLKDQIAKQVNNNQKQNEEISKLNQKLNEVMKANKNVSFIFNNELNFIYKNFRLISSAKRNLKF